MEPVRAGSRQQSYNYSRVVRGGFLPPIDLIVIRCRGQGAGDEEGWVGAGRRPRLGGLCSPSDELTSLSPTGQQDRHQPWEAARISPEGRFHLGKLGTLHAHNA